MDLSDGRKISLWASVIFNIVCVIIILKDFKQKARVCSWSGFREGGKKEKP